MVIRYYNKLVNSFKPKEIIRNKLIIKYGPFWPSGLTFKNGLDSRRNLGLKRLSLKILMILKNSLRISYKDINRGM